MKLDILLSASEMSAFNDLVHQAAAKGAQAVRWHSAQHNLLVIGICDAGEVLTYTTHTLCQTQKDHQPLTPLLAQNEGHQ